MPWEFLAEWAYTTVHPMSQVSHLMHLGHPLPAYFEQKAGYKVIADQLLSQMAELSAHPIQTFNTVLLVNKVIRPRLPYDASASRSSVHNCRSCLVHQNIAFSQCLDYPCWSRKKCCTGTTPAGLTSAV